MIELTCGNNWVWWTNPSVVFTQPSWSLYNYFWNVYSNCRRMLPALQWASTGRPAPLSRRLKAELMPWKRTWPPSEGRDLCQCRGKSESSTSKYNVSSRSLMRVCYQKRSYSPLSILFLWLHRWSLLILKSRSNLLRVRLCAMFVSITT